MFFSPFFLKGAPFVVYLIHKNVLKATRQLYKFQSVLIGCFSASSTNVAYHQNSDSLYLPLTFFRGLKIAIFKSEFKIFEGINGKRLKKIKIPGSL